MSWLAKMGCTFNFSLYKGSHSEVKKNELSKKTRDNVAHIIAQALKDASASVVTNVPGFGGIQVFEALTTITSETYLPSFHEEVAYSIAHGASLVG